MRNQEHQYFVFDPKLQVSIQPSPLDAPTIASGDVAIACLVAFGYLWPWSVRVAVQGGDAHVVGNRVRSVPAHVAVDPVPAPLPDQIKCGDGSPDFVKADGIDTVSDDCEQIFRV